LHKSNNSASLEGFAGIASNYSTVSPSAFHGILAQSLAQSLLDSSIKIECPRNIKWIK
jgi:hypothetical protein